MARSSDPAKAAQWRQRLERFGSSNVAVANFCRREGISVASFYHWRKKIAARRDPPAARRRLAPQPCAFKPLTISGAASPAITVRLPGGTRLEVPASELESLRVVLRELIRAEAAMEGEGGGGSC